MTTKVLIGLVLVVIGFYFYFFHPAKASDRAGYHMSHVTIGSQAVNLSRYREFTLDSVSVTTDLKLALFVHVGEQEYRKYTVTNSDVTVNGALTKPELGVSKNQRVFLMVPEKSGWETDAQSNERPLRNIAEYKQEAKTLRSSGVLPILFGMGCMLVGTVLAIATWRSTSRT